MTYSEWEVNLKWRLQTIYDAGEASSVSNWLLEEYTGLNRHQRLIHATDNVLPVITQKLEESLHELLQHKPLQYVLGYTYFYGLKFRVNESVLIPRPETEELVEWIVSEYKNEVNNLTILDVGTGSGCIPVSIKKQLPKAVVSAIDISNQALEIARENALKNNTDIHFSRLDFLQEKDWNTLKKIDIIISNPPYIPAKENISMDKNVTSWEPGTALFVADDTPLLFYEKLADFGRLKLAKGGVIYMETHKNFTTAVEELFRNAGYTTTLKKDMHGNDRMVKATGNWQ